MHSRENTNLSAEAIVFALRFALLLVLYLFLWQLVVLVWRDLQRIGAGEQESVRPRGRLVVMDSGGSEYRPGRSFPLAGRTTVGRSPNSTIVLGDGFVSAEHAVLTHRDGGWWLADLGSRNGTSVNDQTIHRETRLRRGDVVAFGPVKMRLE